MSWIIASLLNNREVIRAEADIESDEFNDLVLIERAIETLKNENRISDEDLEVLGIPSNSDYAVQSVSSMERHTVAKKKEQICERIAYYLGGYFTNEGYIDYIAKKHKLNSDQVNILWKFIRSRNKHRIIRKPINAN